MISHVINRGHDAAPGPRKDLVVFYGLWIEGQLGYVIRWTGQGAPTLFDFDVWISSSLDYEIAAVTVERACV